MKRQQHDYRSRPDYTAILRVVVLAVAAGLAGCVVDDHGDLHRYVDEIKARKPGRIAPLPEFKTYETYTYSVQGQRDPFEIISDNVELAGNTIQQSQGDNLSPDMQRNKEPLEKFSLDTLSFVGQLELKNKTWGIITAPDGLVHRVQVGNYIGQNHGKIVEINDTRLEIVEIVPDGLGGWIERDASLTIKE